MIKIIKSIEINTDGVELENTYVAVNNVQLIKQDDNTYNVSIVSYIYKDRSAYAKRKSLISTIVANAKNVQVSTINETLIFTMVKDECVKLYELTDGDWALDQVIRLPEAPEEV